MSDIKYNFATAVELCRSKKWRFTTRKDLHLILMHFALKTKLDGFNLVLAVFKNDIFAYGVLPLHGSRDSKAALQRYIFLANGALMDGSFKYGARDGEIRFLSCLSTRNGLNGEALDRFIDNILSVVERYGDGFAEIISSGADPEDEIRKVDTDSRHIPAELLHRLDQLKDAVGEDDPCSDEEQQEIMHMIGLSHE